jgi:hypothetical protein
MEITKENIKHTVGKLRRALEESGVEIKVHTAYKVLARMEGFRTTEALLAALENNAETPKNIQKWDNNSIQYPRLITEAYMAGVFDPDTMNTIANSMDLESSEVHEIIIRAEKEFEEIKKTKNPVNNSKFKPADKKYHENAYVTIGHYSEADECHHFQGEFPLVTQGNNLFVNLGELIHELPLKGYDHQLEYENWTVLINSKENLFQVRHKSNTKVYEIEWDSPEDEYTNIRFTCDQVEKDYKESNSKTIQPINVGNYANSVILNIDGDDHLTLSLKGEFTFKN